MAHLSHLRAFACPALPPSCLLLQTTADQWMQASTPSALAHHSPPNLHVAPTPSYPLLPTPRAGNRLYIMSISAKSLQWRKHSDTLLKIRDSFTLPQKALV